jgi:hypothetical protein
LGLFGNAEDGAGGGAVAEWDADAATGEDVEVSRDGVVEDELGGTVDENAGGERHGNGQMNDWRMDDLGGGILQPRNTRKTLKLGRVGGTTQ